jgi:hypothetical protein
MFAALQQVAGRARLERGGTAIAHGLNQTIGPKANCNQLDTGNGRLPEDGTLLSQNPGNR